MATKKDQKRKTERRAYEDTPKRASRREKVGRVYTRTREKTSFLGKIRWGEALLMAAAGYLTGPALQKSGIANYVASEAASRSAAAGQFFYHEGSGIPGEQMAKLVGTIIGGKGVYDVAKGKKQMGLNVEIPYSIGAILDPKSEYKTSSSGGRW